MEWIRKSGVVAVFAFLSAAVGCAAEGEGNELEGLETSSSEAKIDCSAVKCAMPVCGPRQHLSYQGCCPVCVGPEDRCAAVLCAAVECPEGEARVFKGNDCCGRCEKLPASAECSDDLDCPQFACFACPCPVSECVGRKCVTTTPDASTCGAP